MVFNLNAVDSFKNGFNLKAGQERLFNGAVSEHISSIIYKKNGYSQLNAEVGRNGVDGLFVQRDKNGKIKNIIFSEVKHGDGKLGTIKNGTIKQMSKEWKIVKLNEKIQSLEKLAPNSKELKELKYIKKLVETDNNIVKSQLTRITYFGDNKYAISINKLNSDGTVGKQLKHKLNDNIIDLNKKYKTGSDDWKLQKMISHSVRKEKRLLKEKNNLKRFIENQKKFKKSSQRYALYKIAISKQEKFIEKIEASRPKTFKTKKIAVQTKQASKAMSKVKIIPSSMIKKGKKVLVFMDAEVFKNANKFKNLKFLKNVKGGDVLMMALESGVAVYTIIRGGMTYKKISNLLVRNSKGLAGSAFSKCACFIAPPTGIVIAIAGTIIIDYAIDKYIELDKRSYIGMEDLFWDLPNEIKNKITGLNLEDMKKQTIFNLDTINKKTIFDDNKDGDSIFNNTDNDDKKTIFE